MALKPLNSADGISVGSSPINVIDANGNVSANRISVTGTSNLNSVSNVTITGGSNGQVLTTNGSGGLSWTTISAGSTISNGNSNVSIPSANGNVNISAVGNANVLVVTGTGVNVNGTLDVTGNTVFSALGFVHVGDDLNSPTFKTFGNLEAAGNASFTGSNVSLGNIGNLKITGGSNGQVLTTDGSGNLSFTTSTGGGSSISNGNSNVNIPSANGNVNISAVGNANILVVTGTGATINGLLSITGNIIPTANITYDLGNNTNRFRDLYLSGSTINLGDSNVSSNATTVTVTNPLGGKFIVGGTSTVNSADLTGYSISNGNSNVQVYANSNVAVSVAGNANIFTVTGTGANIAGTLSVSGNANAGNIGATAGVFTGNVSAANFTGVFANGNSNVRIASNSNVGISVAGNSNVFTVTGTGANVNGILTVTGNSTTGNILPAVVESYNLGSSSNYWLFTYSYGIYADTITSLLPNGNVTISNDNGTSLWKFTDSGNLVLPGNTLAINYANGSQISVNNLSNGNSNVNIPAANGNINLSAAGNANVLVVTGTGVNVSGNLSVSGNFSTGGAAGNISGANVISANIFIANTGINSNGTVNFTNASNVSLGAVGNVKITGGTANYVLSTDGSGNLSWVAQSGGGGGASISNGNSNVNIPSANGNVTISAIGNANVVVITGTGVNIAGTLNATGNGTIGGNLNVSGNALVSGNLTVDGNLVYVNVETLAIEDPIINLQTGPNGAAPTSNSGKDVGTALNYYDTQARIAFMGWDVSNAEFGLASQASISSEVVTFSTYGNLRVGNIIGNGQALTGIAGGNVTGQVANALVAGTVYTAAQPNITSVGTLSSLSVSGNANIGNIGTGGLITATGNITGGNITTGGVVSATGNGSFGNINGGNLVTANFVAGVLTTAAQPNITSIGTLSSLTVTGNANAGNIGATGAVFTTVAGTLTTAAQPNITSLGTLTGLTSNGTINFTNASNVSLGAVGNVKITGGTANYVLSTDGSGNLSWVAQSGGGGNGNVTVTVDAFTGNGVQTQFTLSTTPANINYTTVNYNGVVLLHSDYSVTGNVVTIDSAPAANSKVEVYTISGGGGGGGGSANIAIYDEGNLLTSTVSSLDFVGSGVTATNVGNAVTVTITGGGGGQAAITLDSFTGNGVQTAFTLSTAPASENYTFVNIDGVDQLKTAYSVSGTTLTFSSAPSNGANIEVTTVSAVSSAQPSFTTRTYTGNGVQNTFTVTNGVTSTGILVTENGILQTPDTDYTVSGANLTFTTAPANAQAIQIRELGTVVTTFANIANGTSNVSIPSANGNINMSVAGNANVLVVSGSGINVTGTITANNVSLATSARALGYSLVFGG